MRILFDARKISPQATGVGYVVKKLLGKLLKYKDLKITAFTKKGVNKIFDDTTPPNNLTIHETTDDSEYFGLKRVLFEQFEIPKLIEKYKPDIIHLTNGFGVPLFINKKNLKIVLTIHDLIPLTPYKELMSSFDNLLFKTLFSYGIKKADSVVTVSEFTADDVKKYYPYTKNINIVYNGIDLFRKINNFNDAWTNLQKKYNINQEYILYIGGFTPRKNVLRLLESYNKLIKEKKRNFQLLLCGKITNNKDILTQLKKINEFIHLNNLQNKVRVIGYLKPDEKTVILSRAKYFAYLSLYEGFGLPILEALAAGTPVITSKNSVMEEVAEKYACYANPINSKDILVKMQEMLQNYGYYKKLAESAIIELIPKFNWKFSGEKYYQIYKSLL
ncbi:hypothetical protein A2767_00845 [Candidatus Roizmanbacteria bacterium RIFCSPHIGHO2_01_FULL_35_10]|uniref:Glycosyl transferase family 1 domain-containing protein n=1 Tax=Candidatus Roizmanbacteria bacterium RIFCSPLOWO2_01_FULL_35_13 TaxID=1802055 RepID=A0A1F7IDD2_9BACT|nr:MAG: hypothetical protein A2767_00845 [Candidatus Roizmanbacteria bacterium RIFCSPHIGHO2_01_FULL_35_10]OGK41350.1 MAG: hypothetical protein A3A74_03390 [Candidatus Roizmanbacteria bacterium RIFCSPLOWO2_01_FULL_35_13]